MIFNITNFLSPHSLHFTFITPLYQSMIKISYRTNFVGPLMFPNMQVSTTVHVLLYIQYMLYVVAGPGERSDAPGYRSADQCVLGPVG